MSNASVTLVDEALATFAQGPVSITVGSCDRHLRPSLVRATGCRFSSDRARVSVFVAVPQAAAVLDCLRDGGAIAVVFSRPSTHHTYQLKGKCADIGPLQDGDLAMISAYRRTFAQEVAPLGFADALIQALFPFPAGDIVRVSFSPAEAYSQTPGPNAGARLEAGR